MWWIRKLFQFFILFTLRLCREKFRNVRRPNSHINYSPWRIVCPGEKPSYKFNNTGPVLGVVGGSYSSVSLQVEKLMTRNIQGKINKHFVSGCKLTSLVPDPTNFPREHGKGSRVFLSRKGTVRRALHFVPNSTEIQLNSWIIIMTRITTLLSQGLVLLVLTLCWVAFKCLNV